MATSCFIQSHHRCRCSSRCSHVVNIYPGNSGSAHGITSNKDAGWENSTLKRQESVPRANINLLHASWLAMSIVTTGNQNGMDENCLCHFLANLHENSWLLYRFRKYQQKNEKTRWNLMIFLCVILQTEKIAIILSGIINKIFCSLGAFESINWLWPLESDIDHAGQVPSATAQGERLR